MNTDHSPARKRLYCLHGSFRHINAAWRQALQESEIGEPREWPSVRPRDAITETDTTQVYRVPTSRGALIFKRYLVVRPWRYFLRCGRPACEWNGLNTLKSAGIPVPEMVAFGEERRAGMLTSGFVVTREIENTVDLEHYAVHRWFPLPPAKREVVMKKVRAGLFRQLRLAHDSGLYHRDLHWRNILVRENGGEFDLWWIDCPRFHRAAPGDNHAVMVDLSCLARVALSVMTVSGRYRSLCLYFRGDRARARKMMAAIDAHHRRSRHPPKPFDPAERIRSGQ